MDLADSADSGSVFVLHGSEDRQGRCTISTIRAAGFRFFDIRRKGPRARCDRDGMIRPEWQYPPWKDSASVHDHGFGIRFSPTGKSSRVLCYLILRVLLGYSDQLVWKHDECAISLPSLPPMIVVFRYLLQPCTLLAVSCSPLSALS